jgi:hypothetical protein
LQQSPVSFRKALEEFADPEVIARHRAHQGHQFLADVFGDSLLIDFNRQVKASLGGIFMKGALQQVQGLVDLALELFLAEAEEFGLSAHEYAYIYAYFRPEKSARQELNAEINAEK